MPIVILRRCVNATAGQILEIGDVRIRQIAGELRQRQRRPLRIHHPQPVGIDYVIGRPQQQPVHDLEHRRVGADAEGEQDDDGGGRAGRPAKSSCRVSEVLTDRVPHVVRLRA
jgi:hypothetical protein